MHGRFVYGFHGDNYGFLRLLQMLWMRPWPCLALHSKGTPDPENMRKNKRDKQ